MPTKVLVLSLRPIVKPGIILGDVARWKGGVMQQHFIGNLVGINQPVVIKIKMRKCSTQCVHAGMTTSTLVAEEVDITSWCPINILPDAIIRTGGIMQLLHVAAQKCF